MKEVNSDEQQTDKRAQIESEKSDGSTPSTVPSHVLTVSFHPTGSFQLWTIIFQQLES